ncbi:hypothetical protein Anapl_02703 [Anas platyrhynchos]|uniref:Uncharacterized protein n=1 Tax=Anas platyrhynchos TaxID=8839 RepID=R0KQA8_ANAPL|nr:hypothetical protein Anapl_02703 [Anas platyrhynchos]
MAQVPAAEERLWEGQAAEEVAQLTQQRGRALSRVHCSLLTARWELSGTSTLLPLPSATVERRLLLPLPISPSASHLRARKHMAFAAPPRQQAAKAKAHLLSTKHIPICGFDGFAGKEKSTKACPDEVALGTCSERLHCVQVAIRQVYCIPSAQKDEMQLLTWGVKPPVCCNRFLHIQDAPAADFHRKKDSLQVVAAAITHSLAFKLADVCIQPNVPKNTETLMPKKSEYSDSSMSSAARKSVVSTQPRNASICTLCAQRPARVDLAALELSILLIKGRQPPQQAAAIRTVCTCPGELTHCSILCSYKNGMGDNRKALVAPLEREVQDVTLGLGKVLNWIVC